MILVTGPLFAGKKTYICKKLGWSEADFNANAIRDVQDMAAEAEDLTALADRLSEYAVVLSTEVGGGVVPMDRTERENREKAGRLACLLAERAETVIRVQCGLPQVLKGKLP